MADVDARTRSIEERLTRIRERLKKSRTIMREMPWSNDTDTLRSIMLGILDLLDDEL